MTFNARGQWNGHQIEGLRCNQGREQKELILTDSCSDLMSTKDWNMNLGNLMLGIGVLIYQTLDGFSHYMERFTSQRRLQKINISYAAYWIKK